MRKTLIIIWVIFSMGWSGMCIFAFLLGAGMSVGDPNEGLAFLLYWFGPISIPLVIYKLFGKQKKHTEQGES